MEKECSIWLMHPEYKRIPQANNVIRGSYPAQTCSFISKNMRALCQTGLVTFSFEEVTWAPSAIYMCESWLWWSYFVGKTHMKAMEVLAFGDLDGSEERIWLWGLASLET